MVYSYNGILLSLNNKGNYDTLYNMDEPWGPYVKWYEIVIEKETLHDSTFMNYLI